MLRVVLRRAGGNECEAGDGGTQGGAEKAKELAKEWADRRTQVERARNTERADARHERLRRETPFNAHHARKVHVSSEHPGPSWMMGKATARIAR